MRRGPAFGMDSFVMSRSGKLPCVALDPKRVRSARAKLPGMAATKLRRQATSAPSDPAWTRCTRPQDSQNHATPAEGRRDRAAGSRQGGRRIKRDRGRMKPFSLLCPLTIRNRDRTDVQVRLHGLWSAFGPVT